MAETGSASSAAAAAETDSANAEYNAHDDSNRLVADNGKRARVDFVEGRV